MIVVRALALLLFVCTLSAQAQSPVLDTAYGGDGFADGFAAVPQFELDRVIYTLREDGSIYYVGVNLSSGLGGSSVGLMRADGKGDMTFGGDGRFVLPALEGTPSVANEIAADVIEDSRGHALVVGTSWSPVPPGASPAPFVIRIRPDGTPDTRLAYRRLQLGRPAYATSVVQSGGTYLVGLSFQDGGCGVLAVGPTGDVVTTYGDGGVAALDIGSACNTTDLTVDEAGRAIVGLTAVFDGVSKGVVVRLSRTGRLDLRFGNDGLYLPVPDGRSNLQHVVVNDDQRIHTAGYVWEGSLRRGFAARGSMTGRGSDQGSLWRWISPPLASYGSLGLGGLVVLPDGSSYLSTVSMNDDDERSVTLARLTTFGRLDPTFGTGGVYKEPVRPVSGPSPFLAPHVVDFLGRTSAGRLLVGGITNNNVSGSDSAFLLGYTSDAPPPQTARARAEAVTVTVSPNPSRGEVTIRLQPTGPTTVRIYDVLGRQVAEPFAGVGDGSTVSVHWSARTSGVYRVVVDSGTLREVVPVTVAR